jgi:integrase
VVLLGIVLLFSFVILFEGGKYSGKFPTIVSHLRHTKKKGRGSMERDTLKRHPTDYVGVIFRWALRTGVPRKKELPPENGQPTKEPKYEKVFYCRYKKAGAVLEELCGRQYADQMNPAKAARIRAELIEGRRMSRRELREEAKEKDQRWTLNRLWDTYKEQRTVNKALKVDDGRFFLYLKDKFGSKEPREILQLDVDRLRLSMLKEKSPATVKATLALLKRIANFGYGKGLCPGLGFKVSMPKVSNNKTEDLNTEQIQRLIKTIESDGDKLAGNIMLVALFTGMRRGEIFKLKWTDLNFDKGFITIRGPKGGRDETIPMNEKAREVLESTPRLGEYVFPGRNGKQLVTVQRSLRRIKKAAGLPADFRPLHGLRHAFASRLASSGQVDMYTLQKLLTHKSPVMTQRYAHLRDESLRKASELAGSLVDEAVNGNIEAAS